MLLAAALSYASLALASTPPLPRFRLVYERRAGAERCPDAAALRSEVAARLGIDPFQEPAERLLNISVGGSSPEALEAHVALARPDGAALGRQTIRASGSDCTELATSLALAVSIAIDPMGLARRQPAVVATPAPEPTPMRPPLATPPAPLVAEPRTRWALSAGVLGALGLSPAPAAGLRVGVELQRPRFSVALEGEGTLPAGESYGGGQVAASVLVAAIVPCARFGWFSGCGVIQAGALEGSGDGLNGGHPVHSPFVGLGARASVDVPLTSFLALRPAIEAIVPVVQTTLQVGQPPVSVWSTAPVAGDASLSLAVTLP